MIRGKIKEKRVSAKMAVILTTAACAAACVASLGVNHALTGGGNGEEELSEAETETGVGDAGDDEGSAWDWEEAAEEALASATDEADVEITNTDEYVFSDEITALLNERLAGYLAEENLTVSEAEIISVLIPETDAECTCYYTALSDSDGGEVVCLLSYHEREQAVTASSVSYTREEVMEEAWDDNGPEERDVSEEADTASAAGAVE